MNKQMEKRQCNNEFYYFRYKVCSCNYIVECSKKRITKESQESHVCVQSWCVMDVRAIMLILRTLMHATVC